MVYLDNAATTMCDSDVAAEITRINTEVYGNPSSAHGMGMAAEMEIRRASEGIAKALKCKRSEIIFTSGGTEADNLAIRGAAYAYKRRGTHLITTAIEHPAVANVMKKLEGEGFEVTYLPVDGEGVVSVDALKEALTKETILVSVMQVNNETGSVQPLEEIGRAIKSFDEEILFHTDAVQGFGKVPLKLRDAHIDMMSVSSHKIHGPKGAGFLYLKDGVRLISQMNGGGQQGGLRSGTENVAGIVATGLASVKAFEGLEKNAAEMYALKERFLNGLKEKLPEVILNGQAKDKSAPHIMSLSVPGVKAEVLLHALEDKDVYVSAGSACSAHHPGISDTLFAMGIPEENLDCTIRVSLSKYTTADDTDRLLEAMEQTVPMLKKFQAR